MEKGILFVVSAPSGSGKGTILNRVAQIQENMAICVSATTRKPRVGEKDGVDYYFLDRHVFLNKVKAGEMLEYDEHFGNFYGTLKSEVTTLLKNYEFVILEVEVNGAKNISKVFNDCVKIFIVPPSLEVLKSRLLSRKTEDLQSLNERLSRVRFEIGNINIYDYVVVNDVVDDAVLRFNAILEAERQRVARMSGFLNGF